VTLDPQPFDPRELVESVVARSRSLAAQKGIRLTWEDVGTPAEVVLDRQRVSQILVNLVGNALKFTTDGEVRVASGGANDSLFRVTVRDDGPGIPADQLEAIFEEFRQVDGEQVGTGLGLAISRRLARAMAATSRSRARREREHLLPHPPPRLPGRVGPTGDGRARPLDRRVSRPAQRRRRPIRRAAAREDGRRPWLPRRRLRRRGRGRRGASPPAGRHPAGRPDAGHDGREVLRELKADPGVSSIPVIVLSVVDAAEVPEGADGYLAKPVRQDGLLNLLDERCGTIEGAT